MIYLMTFVIYCTYCSSKDSAFNGHRSAPSGSHAQRVDSHHGEVTCFAVTGMVSNFFQ